MWFSFLTNILILVVGVLLYIKYAAEYLQKTWGYFILLTGVAAGVAAFGHLELLEPTARGWLLFVSRVLNILSMFAFMKGVLDHFGYERLVYQMANVVLFSGILVWLGYLNLNYLGSKQAFTPVIIYSIIGMVLLGVPHFILALKQIKKAPSYILFGIFLMAVSAVIFKAIPEGTGIKPSDISHVLIAASLISLTKGFKNIKLNEV